MRFRIKPLVRVVLALGLLGVTVLSFAQAGTRSGDAAPVGVALAAPQIDGDSINNDNLDLNINGSQENLLNADPRDLTRDERREMRQVRHEVKRAISEQARSGNGNGG